MKKRLIGFSPAERPIEGPVDKLGGQPVWRTEPQWPLGTSGEPMMFVCQIRLAWVLPEAEGRMGYLFFTEDPVCSGYGEPDGGDCALIIQPGGRYAGPTAPLREGPTVCHRRWNERIEVRVPVELHIDLTEADEAPAGAWDDISPDDHEAFSAYFDARNENKIGGYPVPTVNRRYPRSWPVPDDWRLLVQLNALVDDGPYFLNFALDGTAYAVISPDGSEGRFWFDR